MGKEYKLLKVTINKSEFFNKIFVCMHYLIITSMQSLRKAISDGGGPTYY